MSSREPLLVKKRARKKDLARVPRGDYAVMIAVFVDAGAHRTGEHQVAEALAWTGQTRAAFVITPIAHTPKALGDRDIVFASDYSHSDSLFPNAAAAIIDSERLAERSKERIMWRNAAQLYGEERQDGRCRA